MRRVRVIVLGLMVVASPWAWGPPPSPGDTRPGFVPEDEAPRRALEPFVALAGHGNTTLRVVERRETLGGARVSVWATQDVAGEAVEATGMTVLTVRWTTQRESAAGEAIGSPIDAALEVRIGQTAPGGHRRREADASLRIGDERVVGRVASVSVFTEARSLRVMRLRVVLPLAGFEDVPGLGDAEDATSWTVELTVALPLDPADVHAPAAYFLRRENGDLHRAVAELRERVDWLTQTVLQQAEGPGLGLERRVLVDPVTLHEHEFVLVPGDVARGVEPFWLGVREVTWDAFKSWAYCEDVEDAGERAELLERGLRPSLPYGDVSHGMGLGDRPAIGMTWRTAEAFCAELSARTGESVGLPTDAQWLHAARLAYGVDGPTPDRVRRGATFEADPWFPTTTPVGTHAPDRLGLYDLVGNAAEWVAAGPAGADGVVPARRVRGGSYLTPAAGFTLDWSAEEDVAEWLRNYPQFPVSEWWYTDRLDVGFRLVIPAG